MPTLPSPRQPSQTAVHETAAIGNDVEDTVAFAPDGSPIGSAFGD